LKLAVTYAKGFHLSKRDGIPDPTIQAWENNR